MNFASKSKRASESVYASIAIGILGCVLFGIYGSQVVLGVFLGVFFSAGFMHAVSLPNIKDDLKSAEALKEILRNMLKSLIGNRDKSVDEYVFWSIVCKMEDDPKRYAGFFEGIPHPVLGRLCLYLGERLEREQARDSVTPTELRDKANRIEQLHALHVVIRGERGDCPLYMPPTFPTQTHVGLPG